MIVAHIVHTNTHPQIHTGKQKHDGIHSVFHLANAVVNIFAFSYSRTIRNFMPILLNAHASTFNIALVCSLVLHKIMLSVEHAGCCCYCCCCFYCYSFTAYFAQRTQNVYIHPHSRSHNRLGTYDFLATDAFYSTVSHDSIKCLASI